MVDSETETGPGEAPPASTTDVVPRAPPKLCPTCGQEFRPTRTRKNYCSYACYLGRLSLDDGAIVERYTKGERVIRIAESLGVSDWTISERLKKRGVTVLPHWIGPRTKPTFAPRICVYCGDMYAPTMAWQGVCMANECRRETARRGSARWRKKHPEEVRIANHLHRQLHADDPFSFERRRRTNHPLSRKRRKKRRATNRRYVQVRLKTDPVFALGYRLRTQIRGALRRRGEYKRHSTFRRLGYTPSDLADHLFIGPQPCPGGCGTTLIGLDAGTDVEHIVPLYTARSEEELWELFRLDNLRLMCHKCNVARNRKENRPLGTLIRPDTISLLKVPNATSVE